jgi:hypothetical protein
MRGVHGRPRAPGLATRTSLDDTEPAHIAGLVSFVWR